MTIIQGERGERQRWQDRDVTNERCSRCHTSGIEVHHRGKSGQIHEERALTTPQFVSDDPEKSVETFLLTAAVRVLRISIDSTLTCLLGYRHVVQTRQHHLCSRGRMSS